MNHDYTDIRALTDAEPSWWDEHAVPRYCEFGPRETASIYARECCLLLIECQECETAFQVAMSWDSFDLVYGRASLSDLIEKGEIHYGDPPRGCPATCHAGATMNSVPRRVLEFWQRGGEINLDWNRNPALEVAVNPEWAR